MTNLLISAGDASGDLHAASFVRAFRQQRPDATFFGLGGGEMRRAGVDVLVDQRELAVGGFFELARSARRISSAWRRIVNALAREGPDLAVLVDSGGFNIPLAGRVRDRCAIPVLYFVAPQVWAWRPGRIRKLAARVDRLAVIFPFEPEVYAGTGLDVEFVGHPLVEPMRRVADRLDRPAARRELELDPDGPLVALMPGSRRNELRHQLPIQLAAARRLFEREGRVHFALGVAPSLAREEVAALVTAARLPDALRLTLVEGRTPELVRAADVVLAKPGTITVETTLLERPLVVVGRANALTASIVRRALTVSSLTMPNLISGQSLVPEFLQEAADPEAIAVALQELLAGPARERQLAGLEDVRRRLGVGGAAERTAKIAEEMLGTVAA